jgi:hypothetical protein
MSTTKPKPKKIFLVSNLPVEENYTRKLTATSNNKYSYRKTYSNFTLWEEFISAVTRTEPRTRKESREGFMLQSADKDLDQ